jgi:hypothetical protein
MFSYKGSGEKKRQHDYQTKKEQTAKIIDLGSRQML